MGDQGAGKSTFFAALGGEWFSDTFGTFHGKEAFEQLRGAWIIEMAELSGLSKSSVNQAKQFISKRSDQYRPAYGRTVEKYDRQCVFAATTNEDEFLQDSTGNRRFMPVRVNPDVALYSAFDLEADPDYVHQLWAEALAAYRKDKRLYLHGEAATMHKLAQLRHQEYDSRTGIVIRFLEMRVPENWPEMPAAVRRMYFDEYDENNPPTDTAKRDIVTAVEVWTEALGRAQADFTSGRPSNEMNALMRSIPGWRSSGSSRSFGRYGKQRYYVRTK